MRLFMLQSFLSLALGLAPDAKIKNQAASVYNYARGLQKPEERRSLSPIDFYFNELDTDRLLAEILGNFSLKPTAKTTSDGEQNLDRQKRRWSNYVYDDGHKPVMY